MKITWVNFHSLTKKKRAFWNWIIFIFKSVVISDITILYLWKKIKRILFLKFVLIFKLISLKIDLLEKLCSEICNAKFIIMITPEILNLLKSNCNKALDCRTHNRAKIMVPLKRKKHCEQCTRLKNKIENNSTWEAAFYQSEWVKVNSSWVVLFFSLYVCCS